MEFASHKVVSEASQGAVEWQALGVISGPSTEYGLKFPVSLVVLSWVDCTGSNPWVVLSILLSASYTTGDERDKSPLVDGRR